MSNAELGPKPITDIFLSPDGRRSFRPTTEQRLQKLEAELTVKSGIGLIDYTREQLEGGRFVRELATELGLTNSLLEKVCDLSGTKRPNKADATRMRWEKGMLNREDASARTKALMQDEQFRASALAALRRSTEARKTDPEHAEKMRRRSLRWWQDPGYRAARSAQARDRWKDPSYRRAISEVSRRTMAQNWQDPEFRAKQAVAASAAAIKRWQDPEQREETIRKISTANRRIMADPETAAIIIQRSHDAAMKQWENPRFRESMSQRQKERWSDPTWRSQTTVAIRDAVQRPGALELRRQVGIDRWQDPKYRAKMKEVLKPPSIVGARADLEFIALSTWEANLARILTYIGRDFITHEQLSLIVPEEYRDILQTESTTFDIDFLTITPRGNMVLYEIMAHPLEDPEGWAKFELARQQYPGLEIRSLLPKLYARLADRFKDKINSDDRFRGWETWRDNLRTNPEKFH